MDVAVLLFEGFDELDAVAPYEVFQTAAEMGADLDVSTRTLVPDEGVTAGHGLTVEPDDVLFGTPDLVVVPGGGWNERESPGVWTEFEDGTLPERLGTLHEAGATIASVCTGAMLSRRPASWTAGRRPPTSPRKTTSGSTTWTSATSASSTTARFSPRVA